MIVYVHYYITGQILAICFCHGHCAVSLPCAANHITGNYNYLCSVPPCLVCYIMQRDPFRFCGVPCAYSGRQHHTKTEKANKVFYITTTANENFQNLNSFLIGAADLFQMWEGNGKLYGEFQFSEQAELAVKTFARDLVFCDMRMM